MSEEENLRIVRGIYEAAARRDAVAAFAIYSEDIVWDFSATARGNFAMKPVSHGHEEVRQAWRDYLSVFATMEFDVLELRPAAGRVLATIRDILAGRASGVPVQATHYALWELADGKVTRLRVFDDRDLAEAAAGL